MQTTLTIHAVLNPSLSDNIPGIAPIQAVQPAPRKIFSAIAEKSESNPEAINEIQNQKVLTECHRATIAEHSSVLQDSDGAPEPVYDAVHEEGGYLVPDAREIFNDNDSGRFLIIFDSGGND